MDAHGRLRRSTSPARRVLKLLRDKGSHRCRRCHSEQLSNHLARVNLPVNTLSINTSPSPCSPIYGTPRLRATWRHWQPSMRVRCRVTCSFLVISARVRRDSSDGPRAMHGVLLRRLDLVVTHPVHHRPQISLPAPATSSITGLGAGHVSAARRPASARRSSADTGRGRDPRPGSATGRGPFPARGVRTDRDRRRSS
jgi:hypothetical protein